MSLLDPAHLTERQQDLLDRADRVARVAAQHAGQADLQGELSGDAVRTLRGSGLAALTVPREHGGLGANLHEFTLVLEHLGRADASIALLAAMTGHILGSAGQDGGWPEHTYRAVARAAVEHGALVNSVASEPELGSPSRGGAFRTTATPHDNGYRLTGRKTWSTGAPALDFLIVHASLPDGSTARLVLPAAAEGVRIERTWGDGLALRGSGSHDVIFDGALVPNDMLLPTPARRSPASSAWFWTAVAAVYLGVGTGALQALVTFARSRVPTALGRPISTLEKIQEATGRIELRLAAAQALLHRTANAWDAAPGDDRLLPALAGAKIAATEAAVEATDLALRAAGGSALSRDLPLERYFRDARAGLMHPPAEDAALRQIGQARLEEPE